MADVGQRVVMDLRNALYRHLLNQSAGFFARRTTGQLLSRVNSDVGHVQQAVSETAGDLARESVAVVALAALLFYYDAWLALFCTISAPSNSCRTSPRRPSPATASSRRSARRRPRRASSVEPRVTCSGRT
jgi:ABC-type multidrug transport system fused ATPase/permease subunit